MFWPQGTPGVLLVPLVSWATPAHVPEGYLLSASVAECARRWSWRPDYVVGDLGYIHGATKAQVRRRWGVGVVTGLKRDMNLIEPFVSVKEAQCAQGQRLSWLGYETTDQLHWFGVSDPDPLCHWCWQAPSCPRQFSYAPEHHETLLGLLPLNTRVARRLLRQVRSWIEPTQAYEKNQLGLGVLFLNSLRLTWAMSLLADAVMQLRALAMIDQPRASDDLISLQFAQLTLGLDPEASLQCFAKTKNPPSPNPQ